MSEPKRTPAPPVPCAVWLTVQFNGRTDSFSRRLFAERLARFLAGTGIRPVVSPRLIGLHHPSGFSPFEISLITLARSGLMLCSAILKNRPSAFSPMLRR